ncbi:putative DNA-binding domain-containing protein [Pseudomonas sp. NPDC099000]|uniref:HvfC/BufC family peptide modification chaperone n=1 Tax=Pseudomonas sp. NPDC099000 TaxID=3364488 RepID=UPI00383AB967
MTLEELAALQLSFTEALDCPSSSPILPQGWLKTTTASNMRRFTRYRSGLWQHQEQSLALTYPVIKALVGDNFFRTLACVYGRRYPSRHPDLGMFGERLATFLGEYLPVVSYPYFGSVASLEWAIHRASRACEATALNAQTLSALSSHELDVQRFTLSPGSALLTSEWPVVAIWDAHRHDGHRLPPVDRRACTALVYRKGWTVEVREIESWESAALTRLMEGATLGEALLSAQERYSTSEAATQLVDSAALVARWLSDALLVAVP